MTGRRVENRIALVSSGGDSRHPLAQYLRGAGFDVRECDEAVVPTAFGAIILVLPTDLPAGELEAHVRWWIKLTKTQRVVVVTSRPTVLRNLVVVHSGRLVVLAAPAFGWDLVDALRAPPARPRDA